MHNNTLISFIICITLVSGCRLGHKADNTHTFKEVGWTVTIPSDFKLVDSASNASLNQKGLKAMEDANDTKVDIGQTRTLITAMKDKLNYFSSTIQPFDPKADGDYSEANKAVKNMMYKTFQVQLPDGKIDSSSTSVTLDGLPFDKFQISVTLNNKTLFNMFLLSKLYKGYDFGISYIYVDQSSKDEIESILKSCKFN
jgi:hypothetical protein